MDKQFFHNGKWEWIRIDVTSQRENASLPRLPAASKSWVESLTEEKNSNLEMETTRKAANRCGVRSFIIKRLKTMISKPSFNIIYLKTS